MKLGSIKTQLIIFLVCFAFYLSAIDRNTSWLWPLFVAIASAVLFESAILYFKHKTFSLTESSVISGLIIGYVISGDEPWWVFMFASAAAVGAKHLFCISKKHLFNPAGLGIFLATFFFGAALEWKGAYLWYVLIPFGVYFITRIKKLELVMSYFFASLVLFGIQAIMQKTPLLNIFGYFSYFFIFIMLIEPKTTPVYPLGKMIFGVGIALLIFIFNQVGIRFDAELCALLVLNLAVPLLNKL